MKVKTRFAPSPTGYLHVGGARTALYSWLFARHHKGEFVLRIEDTDLERSTPAAVGAILESMNWLDLSWDKGPFYQTKRFDRYNAVIDQMLAVGSAYRCYCSKEDLEEERQVQRASGKKTRYSGHCRQQRVQNAHNAAESHVVRFANPQTGSVMFTDQIRGPIEIQNKELDDLIIRRSDGTPTYNFCVVVDDWDMDITHVIRGEDHINNTPRQINILSALGAPIPEYAHVSMIHSDDGQKLSKRHGAVSVMQYRDAGYLPEAVLNYLVRLGWAHGDQEVFSRAEMINYFTLNAVNKSPSAFNSDKLLWLNHYYIMHLDPAYVANHLEWHLKQQGYDLSTGPDPVTLVKVYAERSKTLKELAQNCYYCYEDFEYFDEAAAKKHLRAVAKEPLELALKLLSDIPDGDWDESHIGDILHKVGETLGMGLGKIGMPLRVAITGIGQSPSLTATLMVVGKKRTLARIRQAIDYVTMRIQNTN